jgi:hypothetical protein
MEMSMNYAQLNDSGVVVGVTAAAGVINAPNMIPIDSLDASILGSTYANGVFLPAPSVRHITQLAFLSRFTDAEAVAIDLASIGATVEAASMRRYLSKVNAATFIDLNRPDTRAGVQSLEAGGVLVAGRALEILDAPIQPEERPQ